LLAGCATHASLKTVLYDLPEFSQFEDRPLVIVLVADLHSDIYGKDKTQTPLLERITGAAPDLVVLAGDIYDDVAPDLGTRLLLAGIREALPEAPVFYVTGNHEYDGGKVDAILKELPEFGVTALLDDYALLELKGVPVVIAGVDDPNRALRDPLYDPALADGPFKKAAAVSAACKILICHRPELAKRYTEYGFDLVLSGHTHGGQARLPPLIKGLYAPGQGLFPKYSGGVYQLGNAVLVVSRGLSTRRPLLPRIFNPPEIVVIRLGIEGKARKPAGGLDWAGENK
jgi:predicted MPP superfamily phosphohydrolase